MTNPIVFDIGKTTFCLAYTWNPKDWDIMSQQVKGVLTLHNWFFILQIWNYKIKGFSNNAKE